MRQANKHKPWDKFLLGIVLPTYLAIFLSIASIYFIIIPAFQDSFLENKKEMIQQLTNVAWNILRYYNEAAESGELSAEAAQNTAINEIRDLRYGEENKDYFFIIDTTPRMMMHPYSPELENQKLADYRDPDGLALFVEMITLTEKQQSGFINYTWQTKYDSKTAVPKLSYVKRFDGWQWVVGTGVFLDDVERKTAQISRRLTYMVLVTFTIFSALLIFIALQSYKIEKRRRTAEESLSLSRQKYKALAESATDPMVMLHENRIIYVNKSMCSLINRGFEEIVHIEPRALFPKECSAEESGMKVLHMSLEGNIPEQSTEGLLLGKDGSMINVELSFSSIELGDQKATVMVAKDVRSVHQIKVSDEEAGGKYTNMANLLGLGLFRAGGEENLPVLQASEAVFQLLNISEKKDRGDIYLVDFFVNSNEVKDLQAALRSSGVIKEKTVQMKNGRGGKTCLVSISLVAVYNQADEVVCYDGILEEITEKRKADQERENLIVELQTSLLFLNQPIKFSLKNYVSCDLNTSIADATRIMAKAKQSSILVSSESGEKIGIITDMVLRERVIAENLPYDTPVYKVMSSPLIYIDESALIFEAVLLMQEKGIKHLVVKNGSGETISIISNEELLHVHRYSTAFMLSQIREAHTFEELLAPHARVPRIVKSLTDSGAHAKNITRIITTISDAIVEKIIEFTIDELGEPPSKFAFISLGSEGRGEQTLVTDQDNALIYEDMDDEDQTVQNYFLEFGNKVCTRLDNTGYDFCKGEIMAMNPKWCQPLSVWKNYFSKWVNEGSPQDLLEVSIFFDFRCVYGDSSYTAALRDHIRELVQFRAVFLQHLAQTALSFRPPLDFFGNIQADDDLGPNSFDIKKAINGIVGFARLYAVERALESINTINRIDELYKKDIINTATHDEITEAYNYLMKLRFKHQVKMIDEGRKPDNYLSIDALSHMEKVMLKKAFSQVVSIQKSLSYDISGIA